MGGSMDGMGDLDAPMPPMGAEDGGMEDQMGNDPMGGDMPMESIRSIKNIIDETINDVLDNKEGTKRPEKRMPKEYRGLNNPFKSPFK